MNETMAFFLIFTSCCLHVGWNAISKGCHDRVAFTWLVTLGSMLPVVPAFVIAQIWWPGAFGWREIGLSCASGFCESLYFIFLFASYKHIDMSAAYPLSRGFAPLMTLLLASLAGDTFRMAQIPAVGISLAGVCCLAWSAQKRSAAKTDRTAAVGVLLALLTGTAIAGYHLADRAAVRVQPGPNEIVYLFAMHCFMLLFVTLWALPRKGMKERLVTEWKRAPWSIAAVGIVSFIAYFLVLMALSIGDATLVTAGRNMGIVLSLIVGAIFLKERLSPAKVTGAILVTVGVIMIFLAGNH